MSGGSPRTPLKKLPINCPYCDEPAYQQKRYTRLAVANAIYTPRECPMGHVFYSVETVPEDQDAVEREFMEFRRMKVAERFR